MSSRYSSVRGGPYSREREIVREVVESSPVREYRDESRRSKRRHSSRRQVVSRREYDEGAAGGYDDRDRAPEDRLAPARCQQRMTNHTVADMFDTYDMVVRGSFCVEGVNYSKYEAIKDSPDRQRAFHDAVKDDIISEVGNGVRRDDIKLKIYPGAIKTVVLHYDDGTLEGSTSARHGYSSDPRLVDAEWSLKVDYGVRARDAQRQQNIALALFSAFTSSYGFSDGKTKFAYQKYVDRSCNDVSKIAIVRSKNDGEGDNAGKAPKQQLQIGSAAAGQQQQQQHHQPQLQHQPVSVRPALSPPRPHAALHPAPIPAPPQPVQAPSQLPAPHQLPPAPVPLQGGVFDAPGHHDTSYAASAAWAPPKQHMPHHAPQHVPAPAPPAPLQRPQSPGHAPYFDSQRDEELKRLTDDIYRYVISAGAS